jgi:phosphonate transport system permease protein
VPPKPPNRTPIWLFAILVITIAAALHLQLKFGDIAQGLGDVVGYVDRYKDPAWKELPGDVPLIFQTLAMGVWGTLIAFTIASCLLLWSTRNLAPNIWAYRFARGILNFTRAMPDFLLALVFVAAVGLGPLPGIIALGIHSSGFLGKAFAESLERLPKGTFEGVQSAGGTRFQTLMFAGWPSITREVVGFGLYTFDRNVRTAMLLGIVGAGGIGMRLKESIDLRDYASSGVIIVLIIATVLIIDTLSDTLRRRLR